MLYIHTGAITLLYIKPGGDKIYQVIAKTNRKQNDKELSDMGICKLNMLN